MPAAEKAYEIWATQCAVERLGLLSWTWVINPEDPRDLRFTLDTSASLWIKHELLEVGLSNDSIEEVKRCATLTVNAWHNNWVTALRSLQAKQTLMTLATRDKSVQSRERIQFLKVSLTSPLPTWRNVCTICKHSNELECRYKATLPTTFADVKV
ncbi:hypothetical protein CYMTET_19481 [Cymbomonas tetramitiformis]|uniref:Uncharacterized protein n=1 Tax=Cymbomonas tetramitiformis TaxID=36881 RepID=A0AAE0G7B8_9CHLO|nr:hypothetical protein CYMTET_19481 [Cymbomonas tetramitiformis]